MMGSVFRMISVGRKGVSMVELLFDFIFKGEDM
jgi:hypothetical protein